MLESGAAKRHIGWTAGLAVAALVSACSAGPRPVAPAWKPDPIVVTFWCAPPLALLDDARLAEIAAAGFTTVGAPCSDDLEPAANQRLLDGAARHGLRVWLADHRIYNAALGRGGPAQATAAAEEFRGASALDGYVVADEPTAEQFPTVAATVAALRAADPGRLAYVNLLPDYVPPPLLRTTAYTEYLERFVTEVRPQALSVDYYPFGEHKDRSSFFANLEAVRTTALRHDLPFIWIVLAMPHGPYRDPTEAELAWQVFHALAYGARGISYFTYWTPVHVYRAQYWQFRRGLVEHGTATPKLAVVTRLNAEARAIATTLDGYTSVAVLDSAAPPERWPAPLAALSGDHVTVGVFAAPGGGTAALLVNRSYRDPAAVRVTFQPAGFAWRLDPTRDARVVLPDGPADVTLPPGGAVLVGSEPPPAAEGRPL